MRPTPWHQARAVDAKRQRGEPVGLLAGLPVAVKDVLCIKGQPTTCGSKILQNYRPPYDAHVVERLRAADAVLIGKTNMDEFAMGSSTENSAFQVTRNPWDLDAHPRRLQRRLGGGGGGVRGAAGARHRHRRLDPPAGRPVRRRRPQADLRPGLALRPGRLRQLARPGRPVRPHRGRRRPAAGSHRRPRPPRQHQRR